MPGAAASGAYRVRRRKKKKCHNKERRQWDGGRRARGSSDRVRRAPGRCRLRASVSLAPSTAASTAPPLENPGQDIASALIYHLTRRQRRTESGRNRRTNPAPAAYHVFAASDSPSAPAAETTEAPDSGRCESCPKSKGRVSLYSPALKRPALRCDHRIFARHMQVRDTKWQRT